MLLLSSQIKDEVLADVRTQISSRAEEIIMTNSKDLQAWQGTDQAMYDRLVINEKKIEGMLKAVDDIIRDDDPIGQEIYSFQHPNGMTVRNKTAPFGTVLIIYESRPDVTVEAAMVAFKSNNRILLKGGKEALHSNRILVDCWHQALEKNGLEKSWVKLLEMDRGQTQAFLKMPNIGLDLIVPRGGDGLINFVKQYATCPVLVSGRGNNFLYVHDDADWAQALQIIINAKTDKISACNALDKVLLHEALPQIEEKLAQLIDHLKEHKVQICLEKSEWEVVMDYVTYTKLSEEWSKEYLALKISIGKVTGVEAAIALINDYSGGHSASILTTNNQIAAQFMQEVDAAAVYHNVSTRFTDGGQFGLGAELAISTDKLHHRGPLGLHQLVTNKWYITGNGQVR